jgi:serine/threonine protein phosphatase PrpC
MLDAWLVTDVGVVRDHNEDSAFMEPSKGFFIVADGMGGHAAGEVASAMAVDTVRKSLETARAEIETFKRTPTDAGRRGLVQLLQNAVLSAHQAVYQRGQSEQDKAGMGTTLDVVLVAGAEAFVAHVGDSRTYLIREGRSSQITTDHTVAEVLVIEGKLTIEEAQVSPLRTILVNAIGVSADVGVEMAHVTLKRGDRILLCSDGLHDYFPIEDEIALKLSAEQPGSALEDMVELAKTRGGHDNITGIAVQIVEIAESVPARLDGEPTQPVDVAANPFADEPTETAFLAPPGLPPRMTPAVKSSAKSTQPMRALVDTERPTDPRIEVEPEVLAAATPEAPDAASASATSELAGAVAGAVVEPAGAVIDPEAPTAPMAIAVTSGTAPEANDPAPEAPAAEATAGGVDPAGGAPGRSQGSEASAPGAAASDREGAAPTAAAADAASPGGTAPAESDPARAPEPGEGAR